MAISCARRILVMVSGHQAPAFTVASLATITAGRPSMRAESGDHAGRRAPGRRSGRRRSAGRSRGSAHRGRCSAAMRSRAVILPALVLPVDARLRRRPRGGALPASESVRQGGACAPGARRPRYFSLEKSAGSMKTDSGGLARILPLLLGIRGDLLPFRIGAELRPILLGRLPAGVHDDVDQRGLGCLADPAESSSPRSPCRGA